jgi:hypothetical protein
VRVPETVQSAEAGCRQGFVDGRVRIEPRISLSNEPRILCESGRERTVHDARVARSAAVMCQPGDGPDVELAQPLQPFVGPGPIDRIERVRRQTLPEDRVTDRANAQACE